MGLKKAMTKCSEAELQQKVVESVSARDQTVADEFATFVAAAYEWLQSQGEPTTKEAVMVVAENRALEHGIVPPHWTGVRWCKHCNSYMPCETAESGMTVEACPWDHTEVGRLIRNFPKEQTVPGSISIRAWEIRNKANGDDNYDAVVTPETEEKIA